MNKVTLFGRLVKDPELRKSAKSNLSVQSDEKLKTLQASMKAILYVVSLGAI